MGFWDWYLEPFRNCIEEKTISPPTFKEAPKTYVYRPHNFTEYIGQEKAKQTLKSYIAGIKSRGLTFPHTIIYGNAGCGKTTLARLLANELEVPIIETMASEIDNAHDIIWKISSLEKPSILFLDEVHALERNTVEGIYTVMEDFTYNNKSIMPFTFIGATTELGEIIKTRKPFAERFKLWLELEPYKAEEIERIVFQYNANAFPNDVFDKTIYKQIGLNARATPRTGIRLLEATIYLNGDVAQALKNLNILKDGYTIRDLKCLKYLSENDKGMGLQGLCSYLNVDSELYMYEIEPYLLQNNLIIRTPRGRKLTTEGLLKLKELQQ